MYHIKEMFYTLQGEGAHSGRPAVFCRFTGCNLWSGREADRATAVCTFCDTDFVGTDGQNGGRFKAADLLADRIASLWPDAVKGEPYVVCTGGEPLLQLDAPLIQALHDRHFSVGVETNGTVPAPEGVDWLCLSPKGNSRIVLTHCDELKLVFPQPEAPPERFAALPATHYYLSPMNPVDGTIATDSNAVQAAVRYCLDNPQWRLTLQSHKLLGID
ncbi:MAG: 7-carboxy-7-deazaguanine synthase [Natronospirillum sp.]|uniref:7-carboxy-7-deazaguanine synthase n=1 Tax=Natronospirillum sp. TaxID=2812955 RepID=UPI0026011735|nr:7-carboxy-7-deazaguanine synthase [Natronospirillum sp.]MCH8550596.1 7-carboxy-7-deazaguanine synthase [Natronospirillum sp.]